MATDFLNLADRCGRAPAPDHLVAGQLIGAACRLVFPCDDLRILLARRFIAAGAHESAGMLLIPEWAKLHFLQDTEHDNPAETRWTANLRARAEKEQEPGFGIEWQAWCASPGLALAAASLRASATAASHV